MSIIYLEGPDCAGKTQLINQIRRDSDIFFHNGVYPSPEDACDTYLNQLLTYEEALENSFYDGNLILDRGIMAEQIYGQVIRNTEPPKEKLEQIYDVLGRLDTTIVMCIPPLDVACKTFLKRIDEEYIKKLDQYKMVHAMYHFMFNNPVMRATLFARGIDVILYDYTQTGEYRNEINSKRLRSLD